MSAPSGVLDFPSLEPFLDDRPDAAVDAPVVAAISCLLYTSDAADDLLRVDPGGRRIIKKKNQPKANHPNRNPYPTDLHSLRPTPHYPP